MNRLILIKWSKDISVIFPVVISNGPLGTMVNNWSWGNNSDLVIGSKCSVVENNGD